MTRKQEKLQNNTKVSRGTPPKKTGVLSPEKFALLAIGAAVKAARENKKLSLRAAAEQAHVSEVWLSNLEKNKLGNASLKNICSVCAVVGLNFSVQF